MSNQKPVFPGNVPDRPSRSGDIVMVTETGPIDGLQMVGSTVPTDVKKNWISLIAEAGFREIDIASFVPPSVLPQFADAEEVTRHGLTLPNASVRVLAPNLKGAQRAAAAGAVNLSCLFSASEAHSASNVRRTREQQFDLVCNIFQWRDSFPKAERPFVQVSFSCVFGCSIQGQVPETDVLRYAEAFAREGADDIQFCDTVGYADPAQIRRLLGQAVATLGDKFSSLHVHNTRGLGLANIAAALEVGVRRFDSSLGGLGGCPFAPGATGNAATEDLIYMLGSMGLQTGIDFEKLMVARRYFAHAMPKEPLHGELAKAGLPLDYQERNHHVAVH